jgi:predicted enzyme related to lactoylglutathione lyase
VFLGLRTVIYPAPDLGAATGFFATLLGIAPYFDAPFYVGFNVGGYELGLDPDADPANGAVTYWGVADAQAACAWLRAAGAEPTGEVRNVGDGIRVARAVGPGGVVIGVIENPHFVLAPIDSAGPGR